MASGTGSQRDRRLPNRASHPGYHNDPGPPRSDRNAPVGSSSTSARATPNAARPAAQTITTAPEAWDEVQEQQMNTRLKDLTPAFEAYHNAALPTASTKRCRCTENTRVEVLETIWMWTQENDDVKIYWLNGMAGTGKTTIAYTLCEMVFKSGQLGASFFCSRNSPDCRDVSRIVPTIAYQLGRYSSAYRRALCDILRNDPDIAKRNIETQFEHLIVNPAADIGSETLKNVVVVIDAVDECADVGGTKDVLELLLRHADNLPFKFFVASRPEPLICSSMESRAGAFRSILWLHDIEQSLVEADIKTYLTLALQSSDVSHPEINRLASLAGCLFIFAATAVRYITHHDGAVDTRERLQNVLNGQAVDGDIQYQELDSLYRTILAKALDENKLHNHEIERRQRVLWTVVCAREPLNPTTLSELLNLGDERQIRLAIQSLQSLLHLSDGSEVVSTLHASFPDFLLNCDRSKAFFCNPHDHHSYLATRCFELMANLLRFNICDLETSYLLDHQVSGLESRVNAAVSPGIFYTCRYWSDHMTSAPSFTTLLSPLSNFLQNRFLFWVEVLSLKGQSNHAEVVLSKALDWLPTNDDFIELREFVHDARNFATSFAANPCSRSTPHIYISVLPFTSPQSRIWQTYWPRARGLILVEGAALEARSNSALSTWVVGYAVKSIAQSSDGKRVVSGSGNPVMYAGDVSVWDTSKGAPIVKQPKGHQRQVLSVAFSPDNTRIASGSADCTIKIWDARKGSQIAGPLHYHSNAVFSVAFSPNGAQLVSGSADSTIRLWDARSGTPIGPPIKGHKHCVCSVAFSPDGKHIASGLNDGTIRVWGWRIQTLARVPIEGHMCAVRSVAYSPDGLRLTSGSEDCTVRVWDMSTGTLLAGPFEGHTKTVSSVSFSPSGSQIVSGSWDRTIRVWDSMSGALLAGPFKGHAEQVNSVLFTPDGTRIISGSDDETIRVWDARHRAAGATDTSGDTGGVHAMAVSPDGTLVVSDSSTHAICVWDAQSGVLVAGPFRGHSDRVNSVAFSPDGARIVSGSNDCTLRMWDTFTGASLAGPFEGHTKPVTSVAFLSDGGRVASGSRDATIRIWDSRTGVLLTKPFRSNELVGPIAFSPEGGHAVSFSISSVHMWDADNGTLLWRSHIDTREVTCVALSADGMQVACGLWGQTVLVLDACNGAVLHGPFTGHASSVLSVAFSPDGTHVVSGCGDGTVCVWDVQRGKMVVGPLNTRPTLVSSVAFSPDGARVFSGSWDGTIQVWDLAATAEAGETPLGRLFIDGEGWLATSHSHRVLWVPLDLRNRFGLLNPLWGLRLLNIISKRTEPKMAAFSEALHHFSAVSCMIGCH